MKWNNQYGLYSCNVSIQQMAVLGFHSYIEEAETNYDNQRFSDAGAGFEYIVRQLTQEGNFLLAIHYSYRAIDSFERAGKYEKAMKIWKNLGLFALKVASKTAMDSAKTELDLHSKVQLLDVVQETLQYLQKEDDRRAVLEDMYLTYLALAEQKGTNPEKVRFLEKALKNPEVLDGERMKQLKLRLADIHFEQAKLLSREKRETAYTEAQSELRKANGYLIELGLPSRLL